MLHFNSALGKNCLLEKTCRVTVGGRNLVGPLKPPRQLYTPFYKGMTVRNWNEICSSLASALRIPDYPVRIQVVAGWILTANNVYSILPLHSTVLASAMY
jgi:hypothetical protein